MTNGDFDCQACGACCVEAGKVVLNPDDQIPQQFVDDQTGLRLISKYMGGRCRALTGVIGQCVGCSIYEVRPSVCRTFQPGSPGCLDSRSRANYKINHSRSRPRGYGVDWLETV